MAIPSINPSPLTSRVTLPATGSASEVTVANLPFGVYLKDGLTVQEKNEFISGCVDQVAYTYRKLGGDILDIELTTKEVYASYEESCLEYSYIVNIHQAKNILVDVLGAETGSFNSDGEYLSGTLDSASFSGSNVALLYPRMTFAYAKKYGDAVSHEINMGGTQKIYSASFSTVDGTQDYDLQDIIYSASLDATSDFYNKIGNDRIIVKKVYYKSPRATWRFYGYFGGQLSFGNLSTYGQFADDHTFQVVPVWQHKAQAAAFEDSITTRLSDYSYEIKNNKLRLFPVPDIWFKKIWIEFSIKTEPWEDDGYKSGIDGINNLNTLPFANIPYKNINSIGKHWIRRYALALSKEILSHIRGKIQTVPIPGDSVTLNHAELASEAKEEKEKLREELKTVLDELTYAKLAEMKAQQADSINKTIQYNPQLIYVG